MSCTSFPNANALNYCGGDLYIGAVADTVTITPDVLFTDLSTGKVDRVGATAYNLPDILVTQPTDLTPGHYYSIQVVGPGDVEGISPIEFTPYTMDPATGDHTATGDAVEGVKVRFIKIWTEGDIHSHEEQWITL
jgi:hypothetical protein